jgi:DNA-binding IclR family transcriptional regulator
VVAAVTLAALATDARPAERERHRAVIIEAGRRISANLGYRAVVALG